VVGFSADANKIMTCYPIVKASNTTGSRFCFRPSTATLKKV
jgi:hypothetical protein